MAEYHTTKPVVLILFNRPDCTERVFQAIRRARPPKLLVIADGPRPGHDSDQENCKLARSVIDRVNWRCEVVKNYADVNLGCRQRISSGLDWVFEQVEDAIILEDDCLPHPSFYQFCEDLLDRYRTDERIMMISGNNFQFGKKRTDHSYSYSRMNHIWGWASWRRSWKLYDVAMTLWPDIRDGGWLYDLLGDRRAASYWTRIFNDVYTGSVDTWDYQFVFASWINNALTILPAVNLVTNIGYGVQSTHTHEYDRRYSLVPACEMSFPLSHPSYVIRDAAADHAEQQYQFSRRGLQTRAYDVLRRILSRIGQ